MVVVFKASVEHGVSLALSHAIEFVFVVVAKTEVFHCFSPHCGWNEPAAERCAGSLRGPHERVFVRGDGDRSSSVGCFISWSWSVFRGGSGQIVTCFRRVLVP